MRVIYCPSSLDSVKFSLVPFLRRLFTLDCGVRPWTFVDLVSWIQFVFYAATLFAYCINWKKLERFLYIHGSYLISGALWTAFWFLPTRDGLQTWILDGSQSAVKQGLGGTRNALWFPLLQWCLFVFSRRYYFGIIHWEYENGLIMDDVQDVEDSKVLFGKIVVMEHFRTRCFQIWMYTLPAIPILVWEGFLKPAHITDLQAWPGLIWVILTCCLSTAGLRVFLSMMNFQYRYIAWTDPWERGLAIRKFDHYNSYGIIC